MLKSGQTHYWPALIGAALPFAIHEQMQTQAGVYLVVCEDALKARQLAEELRFFAEGLDGSLLYPIYEFPDWETLPYDHFSPQEDLVSQRLSVLYTLPLLKKGIVIVAAHALMQRLCPLEYIEQQSLVLETGQLFDRDKMRSRLETAGYRAVTQVMTHGEYAVRGGLFDIFPMGSNEPYRIDLLGDELDSLRTFDPETQRSLEPINAVHLLPAREIALNETGIAYFRRQWRARFEGDPLKNVLYQEIVQGIAAAGCEYYLPLFFETCSDLLGYLPKEAVVVTTTDPQASFDAFWQEVNERYEQLRYDNQRPILAPLDLFLSAPDVYSRFKHFAHIRAFSAKSTDSVLPFSTQTIADMSVDYKATQPLEKVQQFLNDFPGRVLFCAESAGRREVLLGLLSKISLYPKSVEHWTTFLNKPDRCMICIAPLHQAVELDLANDKIALITESALFGEKILQQRRRQKQKQVNLDAVVKNLAELHPGVPVVHIEHGIGRYLGLQTLTVNDEPMEFLLLEYANQSRLYVPVSSLHLIGRYTGMDGEHAPLHQLGSGQWEKAKRKAAEQVRDVAAELLEVYAQRAARVGHAFAFSPGDYQLFAEGFPFEETPDQEQAIEQVINDLTSTSPMDRLVCGDVGFGKTEVAMRAAFVVVHAGKQVAILVPTTLLAQQHYENFSDRFANWPIRIELLSRFRSKKQQTEVIEATNAGKVDILIGTHKLLDEGLKFSDLGLLIIDEEHRFGVHQKERFKALRSQVDILTMTATPIPRTLNMALASLRDLSIIASPPQRRLSVKTFVCERKHGLIREAILREMMRGGQVYFLHNDVASIEHVAKEVMELVPEARVHVGHGQMGERDLERVMADFYHQRFNVLVCTTIIETGIDIPTANTIIIDRADKFGLAQLHQLRGRVGRSYHQAYAYLFTPPLKALKTDAVKRLEAIEQLEDLGAGFALATHDLEIRGAGELLGESQSGHVQSIGFSLYMQLLDKAVNALKAGEEPDLDHPLGDNITEVDVKMPLLIPEDYLPDVHERLILYKRIANAQTALELETLQVEMIDRFGILPLPTQYLFRATAIKMSANALGIKRVEADQKGGRLDFVAKPSLDPMKIIQLIQSKSQQYQLDGGQRLKFVMNLSDRETRLTAVENLITKLSD